MGRILEYVVLLSNLSLILGGQQFKELPNGSHYDRENQANFTHTIKQYNPKGQTEFLGKRMLPLDYQSRRRLLSTGPKDMRKMVGLHAFAAEDIDRKGHRRNYSDPRFGNFNQQRRGFSPPNFANLQQRKNSKNFGDFHWEIPSQKLSRLYSKPDDFSKRYQKEGRNARHHPRRPAKICDPCNNVPWVPILNVPDSYRQQRTHLTELHPTSQVSGGTSNFDYHGFATDAHNVLVPPVPLIPPVEPVYDGTISSSFGLPIGNIPTGHGLLAPLNHVSSIDYSSSFNFYTPQGLLDTPPFPELSPVPVVPIHDSGQFYHIDSSIPDLVPPPASTVDVSKVVLTIEENPAKLQPPKPVYHNHKPDAPPIDSHTSHSQNSDKGQEIDFGRLEIVKSVPLAEFTSAVKVPQQQDLPLYPPLQTQPDFPDQKPHSDSNYDFLVPPPKQTPHFGENKTTGGELQGEPSAPKPLTSPSLSWLFSDHTAPPSDSKGPALSFSTEGQEIASVVNNELRPVSPGAVSSSNTGKSKKIQIIIPYTTKNKNEHDNNALESVQHEVFQPPVSKSANENNSLRDFAIPHQSDTDRKVIDGLENQFKDENHRPSGNKPGKYLSEMHHIIATNIRELLREEIEKSQNEPNLSLQNNIDNWTALEYSNHKTVEAKAPKEIITQALAVTSIPGTSISHLLLPSKKIPTEYFKTTPSPVYDEPTSSAYKTTNATVNSSPFTAKPYATTSFYNPTKTDSDNKEDNPQHNHERNYTEVGRGRVNNWGRLNENMVLPEARSKTRRIEESSTPSWSSNRYVLSGSEKVQIVTPISLTTQRSYTPATFRRTTRHVHKSENPTTETPGKFPFIVNSTRLEKVSNETSPFNRKVATAVQSTAKQEAKTTTNTTVLVADSVVKTNSAGNATRDDDDDDDEDDGDEVRFNSKSEHFSINDIFPFRNKELPWQSNLNASQNILRIGRQRKSLIKQVNFQRSKSAGSSS